MMRSRRRYGLLLAAACWLPGVAWADWGENWGAMVWSAEPTPVPTLGLLGLGLLALALVAGAGWSLRRRVWTMSGLLLALVIPLVAIASPIDIDVMNIFTNGEPADANQVNANFDTVVTAVNDNDSRIGTALSNATTAQIAADSAAAAAASEASARSAADAVLQTAVDGEASSRASADTALQNNIAAEVTNRSSADSSLDGRVTTLEASALPVAVLSSGVLLSDNLFVTGDLGVGGATGGGTIVATQGVGSIVVDPGSVTSGYTSAITMDDEGLKIGHNSGARDIQFQTSSTTRVKISGDGALDVNGSNSESDQGLLITSQGALQMNFAGNDSYDIWIQGRKDGSLTGGDSRNLALLGVASSDQLIVNYGGEYGGGTAIQSALDVAGNVDVAGTVSSNQTSYWWFGTGSLSGSVGTNSLNPWFILSYYTQGMTITASGLIGEDQNPGRFWLDLDIPATHFGSPVKISQVDFHYTLPHVNSTIGFAEVYMDSTVIAGFYSPFYFGSGVIPLTISPPVAVTGALKLSFGAQMDSGFSVRAEKVGVALVY